MGQNMGGDGNMWRRERGKETYLEEEERKELNSEVVQEEKQVTGFGDSFIKGEGSVFAYSSLCQW